VRSNPGILELQKGTVLQKLHWNDALKLNLRTLESANPEMDLTLKRRLDSIAVLDQKYRSENNPENWKMQRLLDSSNMEFVEKYFIEKGYPGKSVVGESTSLAAWYVLQHNPEKIPTYLPLIKEAAQKGEISMRSAAMMEDRYLMNEGKPQIYGTQGMSFDDARGSVIWPIEDPETVNERRVAVGFDQSIEEYAKLLFGEDFEYKVLTIDDVKQ
jgi:hypothetical protein